MPAAVIAAGIGVGGSLAAGSIGSKAASKAADTQSVASRYAADLQQRQYEQTRQDSAPWRQVGGAALNRLAETLGLPTYEPPKAQVAQSFMSGYRGGDFGGVGQYFAAQQNQQAQDSSAGEGATDATATTPDYSAFFSSPDYQFRLQEGTRAVEQSAAARGLLRSGQTLRGVTEYGQGLASTAYNNYLNRLASLAGIGQSTVAQTGQLGAQSAAAQGMALQQGAAAQAHGTLGAANAWQNALSQTGSNVGFAIGALSQSPQQQLAASGATPGTLGSYFGQTYGGGFSG